MITDRAASARTWEVVDDRRREPRAPPAESPPAAPPPGPVPGDVIADQFRLLQSIGRGATARVFRAVDTRLDARVAIKVFERGLLPGEVQRRRAVREARLGLRVTDPHVVRLYSLGETRGDELHSGSGLPFIVQELLAGGSLTRWIGRSDPHAGEARLRLVLGVARGLASVHRAGLVHGDVRPANVLLDAGGNAKLIDFGHARAARAPSRRPGLLADPWYAAPEQVRGEVATPASDVFALGLLAHDVLAARPLRRGFTLDGWLTMMASRVALDPCDAPLAELPHEPCALLARVLAKVPSHRPTAAEVVADLRVLLAGGGGAPKGRPPG